MHRFLEMSISKFNSLEKKLLLPKKEIVYNILQFSKSIQVVKVNNKRMILIKN